jgi:alpha-ribazole phosphatase/probable phosphoglycerate mutase
MLTRAFLCRHGEPEESIRGRICGALDVGLSRTGRKQAQGLAAALAPASLAAVYSSPQRRAVETASAIAAACRLAPVELEALREIDFGVFEGLTYDEAAARYPDVYREWMENPARARFPGGETYEDLRARVSEALDEILRRHEGRAFTVVAHGGVIRTVLAISLEVPNGAIFRLDQGYGCVSVVDWLDGAPVVRLINVDAVPTTGGSPLSRLYSTA